MSAQDAQIMDLPNNGQAEVTMSSQSSLASQASGYLSVTLSTRVNSLHRIKVQGMKSLKKTERKCCICNNKKGGTIVPNSAITQMWKEKRIRIPQNNRTCSSHLVNGRFTKEALDAAILLTDHAFLEAVEADK